MWRLNGQPAAQSSIQIEAIKNSAILKGMVPRLIHRVQEMKTIQEIKTMQKLSMPPCHVLPTFYWRETMVA